MVVEKSCAFTSLAEAVDGTPDEGVVSDASVRVLRVGVELLAIEPRPVVASVETWPKGAETGGLTVDPQPA